MKQSTYELPPPIDSHLWSRPCKKCNRRIDKCICKGGPSGYGKSQQDLINPNANTGDGFTPEQMRKMLKEIEIP